MKEYKWYLDWFVWLDYTMLFLFIYLFFSSFPLQKWEWGFVSDKLIATLIIGLFWGIVRTRIVEERRWKWITQELKELETKK